MHAKLLLDPAINFVEKNLHTITEKGKLASVYIPMLN